MTKIVRIETTQVEVARRQRWLLVRAVGDDGSVGLGEATDSGAVDLCEHAVHERFAPRVVGAEAVPNAAASSLRLVSSMSRAAHVGGLPLSTAASAVEMAVWDLAARAAGVRVVDLLGGPVRDRAPVYANLNRGIPGRTAAEAGAAAAAALDLGVRQVKLAPFDGIEPGLSRPALRERLGEAVERIDACLATEPGLSVMVDAHGRFDRRAVHDLAAALADRPLGWVEEPARWEEDPDGLRAARSVLRHPLAAGELLPEPARYRDLLAAGVVDVVMADVKHCGGIASLRDIAALAAAASVPLSLHNPGGPVGTAASLQVAAAFRGVTSVELATAADRLAAVAVLAPGAERLDDGALLLPAGPGLGVELHDHDLAARGATPWRVTTL